MKKVFLLLAALVMMGSSAFAIGGIDFGIGPKVGYQTAKLSTNKADIKADFSNHYTIGLFGRVGIGRLYVQPEVLYFKTGNTFTTTVTGEGNDNFLNIPTGANLNVTLNEMNLQVPVLVGVKVLDLTLVTLRAQAGPTANFIIGSRTLYDYTLEAGEGLQQTELPEEQGFDTKSIAWGFQAGLGADILGKITLDVNYNFGLSKVFNAMSNTPWGQQFDFNNIDNTKQNLFMVTVGFKFL